MKRISTILAIIAVVCTPAVSLLHAEDQGGAKAQPGSDQPKPGWKMPPLIEMTVTGKVSKEEHQGKDGTSHPQYVITDAKGNKVSLSSGERKHHGKGEAAETAPQPATVKLEDYVGKDVTVTGKGFESTKGETKPTRIVEITKIEAVAAPAAPEAPAK